MNERLISDLTNLFGPSGFEEDVRSYICAFLDKYGVSFHVDKIGNVIVRMTSNKKGPVILMDAHMDEVGLMVKYINEKGFLKVEKMGGLNSGTIISKFIKFKTDDGKYIFGITSSIPPHIKKDNQEKMEIEDFYVDIGATKKEEVEKLRIRPGTPGIIDFQFARLLGDRYIGKALDDRLGCAVLLEIIQEIKKKKMPKDINLCFSFSVQEEVGMRGVGPVVEEIDPDVFFAVEGTICADIPDVAEHKKITQLGFGPALTVMDKSVVTPGELIKFAISVAENEKIPYQFKTPALGGTNSGVAHKMKKGIPSLSLATPCRYIHTQASVFCEKDYNNCKRLLLGIIGNIKEFKGPSV